MKTFRTLYEDEDVDENEDEIIEDSCDVLSNKMFEFIEDTVDIDNLDEERTNDFNEILEIMENFNEENNLDEAAKIRKKISPSEKRSRSREYRKNRATLKIKAKKYRKTAKFKKYSKKSKRLSKRGKTSTGKRQTKFI